MTGIRPMLNGNLLSIRKNGSSGIRVGDFDSNLLKKLGSNSWFSEEKQPAWRAGCRPDWLFRNAQFFDSSGISGNAATSRAKTGNRRSRPLASVRLVYRKRS
jgi:hypothetical protein